MKILCLQDGSWKTKLSEDLLRKIGQAVKKSGGSLELIDLAEGDLAYCIGCLRCWAAESGRCFVKDKIYELEDRLDDWDLIIYLTPIVFGTCTPVIKTVVEKGLGMNLFDERHLPQVFIGFADDFPENTADDEIRCFTDIIVKHMGWADIVHPELSDIPIDVFIIRSLTDNTGLAEKFKTRYLEGSIT